MEKLEETLIADLNKVVEDTNVGILRAKAYGYDAIVSLLRLHDLNQKTDPASLNGYNCYGQTDPAPLANPEGPLFTDAPFAPEAAPAAPEEPSAAPAAPEAPPAPMPAEDPGPPARRRGRPRKAVTDDATPSLLPHSEPPAAPAEVAEPAEPVESVVVTDASQDMADDLPW